MTYFDYRIPQNERSRPTGISIGKPTEQVSSVGSVSTRKAVDYAVEDSAAVCTSPDQNLHSSSHIELASGALVVGASLLRISTTAGAHSEDEILKKTYLSSSEDRPSSPLTPIEEEVTFYEGDPATSEHTAGDTVGSNAARAHFSDEQECPSSGDQVLSNEEPPLIDDTASGIPLSAYSIPFESASRAGPRFGDSQLESEAVDARPTESVQEEQCVPTKAHEVRIFVLKSKIQFDSEMKSYPGDPK